MPTTSPSPEPFAPPRESSTTDAVLEETRRIKDTLAASMNYDIPRIIDAARRRQRGTTHPAPAPRVAVASEPR